MTAQTPKRVAWEDKFRQPTQEELIRSITGAEPAEHLRELRKRLLSLEGVNERVEWQGVPWRWTLVYSCAMDPTRAFAYLVPDPAHPQVAIPLTVAMVQTIPLKRMKKAVRDGVMFSKFVAGVYWPCWQLEAFPQIDELSEILQRKYRGVVGEWGGAGGAGGGGGVGGAGGAAGGAAAGQKTASKKPDHGR
jgi:hypothetical protein